MNCVYCDVKNSEVLSILDVELDVELELILNI